MEKTIVLGAEYDDGLRSLLLNTLKEMGAAPLDSDWAAVGSQEVEESSFDIDGKIVRVEAETYIGLSISGEAMQIDMIVDRLNRSKGAL